MSRGQAPGHGWTGRCVRSRFGTFTRCGGPGRLSCCPSAGLSCSSRSTCRGNASRSVSSRSSAGRSRSRDGTRGSLPRRLLQRFSSWGSRLSLWLAQSSRLDCRSAGAHSLRRISESQSPPTPVHAARSWPEANPPSDLQFAYGAYVGLGAAASMVLAASLLRRAELPPYRSLSAAGAVILASGLLVTFLLPWERLGFVTQAENTGISAAAAQVAAVVATCIPGAWSPRARSGQFVRLSLAVVAALFTAAAFSATTFPFDRAYGAWIAIGHRDRSRRLLAPGRDSTTGPRANPVDVAGARGRRTVARGQLLPTLAGVLLPT